MLTQMTEEDCEVALAAFDAAQSSRCSPPAGLPRASNRAARR